MAIHEDLTPSEIRVSPDKATMVVTFFDGSYDLAAEFLRISSPSAEVQGHSPAERVTLPGKRNVKIKGVEPVGSYAIRIIFDDGHDTGYYTWEYLYELGRDKDTLWQRYLTELDAQGKSRD